MTPPDDLSPSPTAVLAAAARSTRLQTRRLELLPLRGPNAVFTDVQGRRWGTDPSTSPAELADLISSIATCGLLQPVLVQQLPDGARHLAAGERRLLAMRWGAVHLGDNLHFEALPANVVDGPLSTEELRVWQLVENLARTDLKPGELAAALLYERCAVLTAELIAADVDVDEAAKTMDDPTERWRALDQIRTRAGLHSVGAPWSTVIGRLGLELSADKAKRLVAAFRAMPVDVAADMDDHDITLASRMEWLRLDRGRHDAAAEIWDAIKARGRTDLLTRACREARTHSDLNPQAAVDLADQVHQDANASRRAATIGSGHPDGPTAAVVPAEVVNAAKTALADLLTHLADGDVGGYDRGSLVLLCDQVTSALDTPDVGTANS